MKRGSTIGLIRIGDSDKGGIWLWQLEYQPLSRGSVSHFQYGIATE